MSDFVLKPPAEAQAYIAKMEEALLVFGLNPQNETIDLRDCARAYARGRAEEQSMLDAAQARAKDLEGKLEALKRERHDETLRSGERIQDLTRRCADLEANAAKLSSAEKPDPTRDYNAEIVAARIDALKTLGVNPYDPPVCIAGAAKKRARTLEHADKLESDVAAVWELWGAGREVKPGALLEVCQEQEQRLSTANAELNAIAEKLNGAKVPTHYGRDQKGGPVLLPERVGLLIDSHNDARASADSWEQTAYREIGERMDAVAVLDDLGAPAHAGPAHLTLAARILAIPGLLRQD